MLNGEEREDSAQVVGEGELSTPLVPPLRFTQDDGTHYPDWENKKFGTLGETYSGLKSKTKEDFEEGVAQYIPFTNIMKNTIVNLENLSNVKVLDGENQNQVEVGDLLFNGSSETPEEVGFTSVLLTEKRPLYLNSFCFGFRTNNKAQTNTLFLAYLFRSTVGRKIMTMLAQGSTRYNLPKRKLMEATISLPTLKEQEKIANLLSLVDGKIENLDQQRELWREYKRGLGARLFTQEYRFTQDDGTPYPDWETVQLGEVAKLYQSETLAKQDLEGGENPVYGANGIIGWTNKSNHRTSQVVVACRGVCGIVNYTKPISWINGNSMVLNIDENETINKQYFYYAVSQISFEKIVSGSAQPQITRKPLSKITLSVPSLGEQEKIGRVLGLVDGKIESLDQQHKLWREYKQALLQQLFP